MVGGKAPDWRKVIRAIDAARFIPAAGNKYNLKFVMVSDPDLISQIGEACQQHFISEASYIVVCVSDEEQLEKIYGDRGRRYTAQQAGAALENFLLALTEEGLATYFEIQTGNTRLYYRMKNVMLDLETFGTSSNAVITSIGAVQFDPVTGKMGDTYYNNVELTDQVSRGRSIEGRTVLWWLGQSDDARRALYAPEKPAVGVEQALVELMNFWPKNGRIWSHATFDAVILRGLYDDYRMVAPWHFRDVVDIRTLNALVKGSKIPHERPWEKVERHGTSHNALDDAIHQVQYCSLMWQHLTQDYKES